MSFLSWPYVEGVGAWGENTSAYKYVKILQQNWVSADKLSVAFARWFVQWTLALTSYMIDCWQKDYYLTPYIAEFISTSTNLGYSNIDHISSGPVRTSTDRF